MPRPDRLPPGLFASVLALTCAASAAGARGATLAGTNEAAFLTENSAAMTAMMNGMAINPTGDVDRDFATMMIAHHQGAIDMAQAELRHGTNERLRRIAQEIVIDQLAEIAAMHLAAGDNPPPPGAAPAAISTPARTMPNAGAAQPGVTAK